MNSTCVGVAPVFSPGWIWAGSQWAWPGSMTTLRALTGVQPTLDPDSVIITLSGC
jgi:hypothetical protein